MKKADSTEINPSTQYPVIDILESQKKLMEEKNYGGTMRLGAYAAILDPSSKVYNLYSKTGRLEKDKERIEKLKDSFRLGELENSKYVVLERHRHRYEVSPKFIVNLEDNGIKFSGYHVRADGTKLMEFMELPSHKFFIGTQGHPEFKSHLESPAPLFLGFVRACLE